MTKYLDLAEACSEFLGARYPEEAPDDEKHLTGEMFREEVLLPALRDNDRVIVDLDNVIGFTWSFIDEAFGGAVWAVGGLSKLKEKLEVVAPENNQTWKERAETYMREAEEARVLGKKPEKRWRMFFLLKPGR